MSENPKIRLFVEGALFPGSQIILNSGDSHYLLHVMRRKKGDEIALFNGRDGEWAGIVVEAGKKKARLEVADNLKAQKSGTDLWLAFSPIKRARIDFVAQKATELGVSKMLPVKTARTVVTRVKGERLLANAKEAAEQCERLTVPTVEEMTTLKALLSSWPKGRKLLFCDEDKTGPLIVDALKAVDQKPAGHPWGILVGPEGGFTGAERKLVRAHPECIQASLGPRLLRADTAVISALSLWQAAVGDW